VSIIDTVFIAVGKHAPLDPGSGRIREVLHHPFVVPEILLQGFCFHEEALGPI
jgi:hypothetical protein